MPSHIQLIPKDENAASLTLSESTGVGIWLDQGQESLFPIPQLTEAWSEGEAGEGSKRISTKVENPVGTGRVYIAGETEADFRKYVAFWQEVVHSVNTFGGSIEYIPEGGDVVMYEVRSMSLTSLPQDGVWIQSKVAQSEFTITFAPFGELEDITVFSNIETTQPVTSFDIGERAYSEVVLADGPSLYWRLGTGGTTDQSGNSRNGTGSGEITIGGSVGALANDTNGSTTFDGVNDKITSTYSAFTAGSVRTFEGWGYRVNSFAASYAIFAGSKTTEFPPVLFLKEGGQTVVFNNNTGSAEWTSAWPGVTKWVHWALIFDDPNDTVELFINGVSCGVRAFTATYSSPGTFQIGAWGTANYPFNGKQDEVAVYAKRLSPERIFAHYLAGAYRVAIPGSAPAKIDLTITDTSGMNRDHFEYGVDSGYDIQKATPILIGAPENVVTSEFAGAAAIRVGAYSGSGIESNVVRATLYTAPIAICGFTTEAIGKTRVKARIYGGSSAKTYIRLAWRIGEADFTYNEWQKVATVPGFYEIDLGVMNVPKAEVGSQGAEGWIEAYTNESGASVDIDYLMMLPLTAYGKASVEASTETSAAPVMYDDGTSHSVGALSGTSAPIGGVWTAVKLSTGEANITVNEAKEITYSATNAEGPWKNAAATTATPAALGPTALSWDAKYTTTGGEYFAGIGGVVRYVDQWNYLAAYLQRINSFGGSGILQPYLSVIKAKGGYTTYEAYTPESAGFAQANVWWSYKLAVDSAGVWSFQAGARGSSLTTYLSGQDADLASGALLGTGKVGIIGNPTANTASQTTALYWDNIVCFSLAPSKHLINASKSLELTSSAIRKQPTSGAIWTPETLEGGYPKVEPNRVSRIVVKTRANNVDSHSDSVTWNGPIKGQPGTSGAGGTGTSVAEAKPAKPSDAKEGAFILGTDAYGSSGSPHGISLIGISAEKKWTQIQGSYGLYSYYWMALDSDPEYVAAATGTGTVQQSVGLVPYFGVDPSIPVNVSATASGTGTTITAKSVTTTVKNSLIVVAIGLVCGGVQPTVTGPATMTRTITRQDGTGTLRTLTQQFADNSQQSVNGSSGTRVFTLSESAEWVAHTIALAPAKPLDSYKASLTITPRVQLVSN